MVLSHFTNISIHFWLSFVYMCPASGVQYIWEYYFIQWKRGLLWLDIPILHDVLSTVNWVAWSRSTYVKKPLSSFAGMVFLSVLLIKIQLKSMKRIWVQWMPVGSCKWLNTRVTNRRCSAWQEVPFPFSCLVQAQCHSKEMRVSALRTVCWKEQSWYVAICWGRWKENCLCEY